MLERPLGKGRRARIAFALLRLFGWRVVLAQPVPRKCVVVFFPHTSNWDFPAGLLAKWATGIDFRWIGKHTLFATPFGRWFARWGGIPVDRGDAAGFVDQVAAMLSMQDNLRRLEARVAELQLKLAAAPPSFTRTEPPPATARFSFPAASTIPSRVRTSSSRRPA